MTPVIQLATGGHFNFANPEASDYTITDIAIALGRICRFTGHSSHFHSVAHHSVLVSQIVPPEHAFAGLMHDAAEAFLGDVSRPLKQLLPDYRAIEERVESAIRSRFGLPPELPECVKEADLILLATEKRDLMPSGAPWALLEGVEPMREVIVPCDHVTASGMFMRCLMQLPEYETIFDL